MQTHHDNQHQISRMQKIKSIVFIEQIRSSLNQKSKRYIVVATILRLKKTRINSKRQFKREIMIVRFSRLAFLIRTIWKFETLKNTFFIERIISAIKRSSLKKKNYIRILKSDQDK
jgi:hypothetical protein